MGWWLKVFWVWKRLYKQNLSLSQWNIIGTTLLGHFSPTPPDLEGLHWQREILVTTSELTNGDQDPLMQFLILHLQILKMHR